MPLHGKIRSFLLATTMLGGPISGGAALSGATALLVGETDGFAIDATTDGGTLSVKASSVLTSDNVAINPFLTQSGTSPKLCRHTSTLKWSAHNLFLNSATPATQNVTLVTGLVYTIWVTGAGGGNVTGSSGASGTATTGSPATFTATGTTGTFTLTGSLTTMQLNRGPIATAVVVTTGAAKYSVAQEYDGTEFGILVEPAATNLVLRSQELDHASWFSLGGTTTANDATAPDGSATADTLTLSSASGGKQSASFTTTTAVGYTLSVFAKYVSGSPWLEIDYTDAASVAVRAWFDIQNGVVGATATAGGGSVATASSIISIGNGWYRCICVGTLTSITNYLQIIPTNADASHFGSTSAAHQLWGFQVELGTVATSHIPTAAATVTRALDHVNVATSAYPHSNTAGTIITWVKSRLINHTNDDRLWELSDSTDGNRKMLLLIPGDAPDSFGRYEVVSGVQVDGTVTKSGSASLSGNKTAGFWTANDSGLVIDGGSEVVDTVNSMPVVTLLNFGNSWNPTIADRSLNGFIKRFIFVPRRMTTGQMQTATT